jgi:hypothetical protein
MEQVLGIVGFSLGASLGVSAVRSVTDGSRSIVRDVLKLGIRTFDVMANATSAVRDSVAQASNQGEDAPRRRTRRGAEPRKIEIAHN